MFSAADQHVARQCLGRRCGKRWTIFESIDRRLEEYGPLEPRRFSPQEADQRLAQCLDT